MKLFDLILDLQRIATEHGNMEVLYVPPVAAHASVCAVETVTYVGDDRRCYLSYGLRKIETPT